jgi:hypothetical protein
MGKAFGLDWPLHSGEMEGWKVHKGISAIVVFVGLLGIVGCGGGSSSPSSVSQAEYEQQAELICNEGLQQREEVFKEVSAEYERRDRSASAKETAEEQAQNVRKLMAAYDVTTEELTDVGLPEQDEKKAEELLREREKGSAQIEADPQKMSEFIAIFAKAGKIAQGLEVASCGK